MRSSLAEQIICKITWRLRYILYTCNCCKLSEISLQSRIYIATHISSSACALPLASRWYKVICSLYTHYLWESQLWSVCHMSADCSCCPYFHLEPNWALVEVYSGVSYIDIAPSIPFVQVTVMLHVLPWLVSVAAAFLYWKESRRGPVFPQLINLTALFL